MELSIQERLKDLRVERGLTLEQLAEQTHLSKSALGSYEGDNLKDISHYALIELAKFYEVTVDYLLGRSQTRNHPNADLADLHLSDDMIELLKSGLVDNSLLCELATHPDFPRLMADLEVSISRTKSVTLSSPPPPSAICSFSARARTATQPSAAPRATCRCSSSQATATRSAATATACAASSAFIVQAAPATSTQFFTKTPVTSCSTSSAASRPTAIFRAGSRNASPNRPRRLLPKHRKPEQKGGIRFLVGYRPFRFLYQF